MYKSIVMDRKNYITPEVKIMKMYSEGLLCTSQEGDTDDPLVLPGTSWEDETVW